MFFFCKQKTAYEMRISDCSSDVFSSYLLIFRALLTIDGVLTGIQPDFDLSGAMTRAGLRVARARLAPDRLQASVQALMWEMLRLGDDAPRLIHAAVRRLEAPPMAQAATNDVAIRAAGRWIAGALLAG